MVYLYYAMFFSIGFRTGRLLFNKPHRFPHPIFSPYQATRLPGAGLKGYAIRLGEGGDQLFYRQLFKRDGRRSSPDRRHPLAPKHLVRGMRQDDVRDPGAQPRGSRACSAMMDDGFTAREQPVMRGSLEIEQIVIWF